MEDVQEALARLRAFGLGEYAARTYVALLELGTSDVRAVSRLARVPVGKVYAVLDQLESRGFVRALHERPKRYEPVPIADVLAAQRRALETQIHALDAAEPDLARLFPMLGTIQVGDRGSLSVLRSRGIANDRVAVALKRAQREILYAPSASWPLRAAAIRDTLAEAAARKVRNRLLIHPNHSTEAELGPLRGVSEVRVRDVNVREPNPVTLVAADGEVIFLQHHVPDDKSATVGSDYLVELREEALVRGLLAYIESRWNHATTAPPR